ncbi:cytochrome C oxidase subunit IV [Spongiactinospora gelatinilytica]|uniref:Cytochrome c oxidase polypeptide 4 n=1 Tax=Spongiactinospora gelatinilytica TaxID=2666298 RepID=A0A2W2H2Z6_9ACTN|nr:cytochrome c oxidase subunit 4 [Spongiactinospora gelatinilytica]PZG54293.1 cytochrome C oxidase subunit IV [Spongiactinospora gelatinilytica]
MKVQGWLFLLCGVFFALVGVVYWFWSGEPVGTTALAISVGFAFMIGYYLMFTARRIGAQPEDDKRAEISDGAGEIGFFSPHSWWPLFVTLSAALAFVGFVIGWWLFMIGVACVIMSSIGFVFQYYRGHFSH